VSSRDLHRRPSIRWECFLLLAGIVFICGLFHDLQISLQRVPSGLLDGVIGSPHIFGVSEGHERWWVGTGILSLIFFGLFSQMGFQRLRALSAAGRNYGCTFLTGILLAGYVLFGHRWQLDLLLMAACVFFPWQRMLSPLWKQLAFVFNSTRIHWAIALVASASTLSFFGGALIEPMDPEGMAHGQGLRLVGSGLVLYVLFVLLRSRVKPIVGSWLDITFILSPILPLFKTLAFTFGVLSFEGDSASQRVLESCGVGVVLYLGGVVWLGLRKERTQEVFHFFSIPVCIYLSFYRFQLLGGLDLPHEADIFLAARGLLAGEIPYRDLLIPHGIGNAWLGTLGMQLWEPTLTAFRLPYLLLTPLVWVLHYLFFLFLMKRNHLTLVLLLTFFCTGSLWFKSRLSTGSYQLVWRD